MTISKGCLIKMSIGRFDRYTNNTQTIFDWISRITNDIKTAIDISSWCEIAAIGETYEKDNFIIEIILDD